MPTSFLSADEGFPRLTSDVPMEERMNRVRDYLFNLLEQLRYILSNLSAENFNDAALKEIEEAMTGPIRNTVTDLAGNVSTLEQTAAGLTSTVSELSGNVTSLTQTANNITARLNDVDGNHTTIEAFATGTQTTVSNLAGDVTLAQQTANMIKWIVDDSDPDTTATTFTLKPHMADLIADEISITGVVTFNDLKTAGRSVINGDNIELKADADGDSVSYLKYTSANGNTFAEVHTRDNTTGTTSDRDRYAFVIETPVAVDGDYCALKLEAGDSMSLEAGFMLYQEAMGQIVLNSVVGATRISANTSYADMPSRYKQQQNAYYHCTDGIYYGSTKILST